MTRPDDIARAHDGQIDSPITREVDPLSTRWCRASMILSALCLIGMALAVLVGWW